MLPVALAPRNPLWAVPLDSLHYARERPLFSASRRPPAPIVAEAPKASDPAPALPAAPEKPQVTLVGTVRSAGVQMGVFVDETDQSQLRLRVGQSVRGWTVDGVDKRAATLDKSEHEVKLELPARNTETAAMTPPVTGRDCRCAARSERPNSRHSGRAHQTIRNGRTI